MGKTVSEPGKPEPTGVITLLDVLGWKGVYRRKTDAIGDLQFIAEKIRSDAKEFERGINDPSETSRVVLISDTIVVITNASNSKATQAIDLHGRLCRSAIRPSIKRGIPLRGASSFGRYTASETNDVFVGEAIDEAAMWHEAADWIGVFMTPSALYTYNSNSRNDGPWTPYQPPLKSTKEMTSLAVNWLHETEADNENLNEIKKSFREMAPLGPSVITKYRNTIKFLKKQIPNHEGDSNARGTWSDILRYLS